MSYETYVSRGYGYTIDYSRIKSKDGILKLIFSKPEWKADLEKIIPDYDTMDVDEFTSELNDADWRVPELVADYLNELYGVSGYFFFDSDDYYDYVLFDTPTIPLEIDERLITLTAQDLHADYLSVLRILYEDPSYNEPMSMLDCINCG